MYVIRPISPSSPMWTPSYNSWANAIVRRVLNPRRREASCCNVLVMNGGCGPRLRVPFLTSVTVYSAFSRSAISGLTVSCVRSEEHKSELQSPTNLVCRPLLEKKKTHHRPKTHQTHHAQTHTKTHRAPSR